MNKIFIYSEDPLIRVDVQKLLDQFLTCKVVFLDEPLALQKNQMSLGDLLILDMDTFSYARYKEIRQLQAKGFRAPILVIFNESKFKKQPLEELERLHLLKKPYTEKKLITFVKKLVRYKAIPAQRFQRFYTDQPAELESLSTGSSMEMNIYNLSQGGAYFEFTGNEIIEEGDYLRLRISLNDTMNEHIVNAKVVWVTDNGNFTGQRGIGCQFVTREDMYRFMLEKM